MHQLLRNTESLDSMRYAAEAMDAFSVEHSHIDPSELSFETFFSNVANRFVYGSNQIPQLNLAMRSADVVRALTDAGYLKIRTVLIPVAPGFNGKMKDFIPVMKRVVDVLTVLPTQLKTLKAHMAWSMNDPKQLQSMTGAPKFRELTGADNQLMNDLKSFFKPNSVNQAPFGMVFENVGQWAEHYSELSELLKKARNIDFLEITKLSNEFSELSKDFHELSVKGNLNKALSAAAIADLSGAVQRLATAVTLSAVMQNVLHEVVTASNAQCVTLGQEVEKVTSKLDLDK